MARCEPNSLSKAQNLKPFRIPCKLPYDELIKKYSDELEIRCVDKEDLQNNNNNDINDNDPTSNDNNTNTSGEPQFKVPLLRRTRAGAKLNNTKCQTTKSVKRKGRPDDEPEPTEALDAIQPPSNPQPPHQKRSKRKQEALANGYSNNLNISQILDVIDTEGFVDETMVSFTPEFCQRAAIQPIPNDPVELCKKFTLIVPDCEIYKFDELYNADDQEAVSNWRASLL